MLRKKENRLYFPALLREYLWVFVFISLTFSGFLVASSYQKNVLYEVEGRIKMLELRKKEIIQQKNLLQEKIMSTDDEEFIKMTLIRVLGVTPKGQKKIVFDK